MLLTYLLKPSGFPGGFLFFIRLNNYLTLVAKPFFHPPINPVIGNQIIPGHFSLH